MEQKEITNEKALKALEHMKNYCSATNLDELNYVIKVIKKLNNDGITNPLETDFTSLKK